MSETMIEPTQEDNATRRSCRGKRRFLSITKAREFAREKRDQYGVPYVAVPCQFCEAYHVERKNAS